MTELLQHILEFMQLMGIGPEHAKQIGYLAKIFEASRREVEQCTEEIRDAGYPLCSSCAGTFKGLYLARSVEEFLPYYRQLGHRIAKMSKRRTRQLVYWQNRCPKEAVQLELELSGLNGETD